MREDEALRIVPQELWETVRERRKAMRRTWPSGNGRCGFSADQGGRQAHFPTHLLAGAMTCGSCAATIAQVSGKNGGYCGCLAAAKGACDNKTLVRRTLAEKVILETVKDELRDPEAIAYVLCGVEEEVAKLRSDLPDSLKLNEAELSAEQRRLAIFVDFIGEGRGSQALAKAVVETERRLEMLSDEVPGLRQSREKVFQAPPGEWIKIVSTTSRMCSPIDGSLGPGAPEPAGPIRPDLITPNIGRPFYEAVTTIDTLALIDRPPLVRRPVRILCQGGDGWYGKSENGCS